MVLLTYFIVLAVLSVVLGAFFNFSMSVKPFIRAWWLGIGVCFADVMVIGAVCVFLYLMLEKIFS